METTKVHRVTLTIIDHDDLGADGVREVLEHARYANRCISPRVMAVETRDVEWSDAHPLNHAATADAAIRALFRELSPGATLIAIERERQVRKWGNDHDDEHTRHELARNGANLALVGTGAEADDSDPWGLATKCGGNDVGRLAIAGALIAAEIDRLLRLSK